MPNKENIFLLEAVAIMLFGVAFCGTVRADFDLRSLLKEAFKSDFLMGAPVRKPQYEFFYSHIDKLFNVYCTHAGQEAKALFVFRAPGLTYNYKDVNQQKEIVSNVYSDAGWEIPHMGSAHETEKIAR